MAETSGQGSLADFQGVSIQQTETVAYTATSSGDIAVEQADLRGAEDYFGQALTIDQLRSPERPARRSDHRCLGLHARPAEVSLRRASVNALHSAEIPKTARARTARAI